MRASQIRLALLLALLLAFPAVAQFIGGGSIGAAGGGGSFTGGTVSGSPVVFSAPASASNMVQITGVTGQTGDYFAVQGEDDSTPRFRLLPNGTSGSLWFSYRPITTGAAQLITDIGTTSQSVLNVTNNSKLNAPNGFDVAGTISGGALTVAGPFSVASTGRVTNTLAPSYTAQTCNCGTAGTPNTVTCDITSGTVYLTDGDADACTVTISETTAAAANIDLGPIAIIVTSLGGGGSYTIADSAGVIELAGGVSFTGNSVGDALTIRYLSDSTTDTFIEMSRADN